MVDEKQLTIERLEKEREEARDLAWKYRNDIRQSVSQELWEKHWRDDTDHLPLVIQEKQMSVSGRPELSRKPRLELLTREECLQRAVELRDEIRRAERDLVLWEQYIEQRFGREG